MVVFGTRPEAIKLAPVIQALRLRTEVTLRIVSTSQHKELLEQALRGFAIRADVDLQVMRPGQTLEELTTRVLPAMQTVLADERPDVLVVQGDTTTVFVASLAAFYQQIPVAHVEAGLRSHNPYNPFPEEMNRRLTSAIAALHFAPTELARSNLLAEGIAGAHDLCDRQYRRRRAARHLAQRRVCARGIAVRARRWPALAGHAASPRKLWRRTARHVRRSTGAHGPLSRRARRDPGASQSGGAGCRAR